MVKAKSEKPTGPTCPFHGKELGLANGGLHCPIPGCHHRAEVGTATMREDHGYRPLREIQSELTEEDINPDAAKGREPNLDKDGNPVLEEVGSRQSEENAHGVPRITEGPDGKQTAEEQRRAEGKTEAKHHGKKSHR